MTIETRARSPRRRWCASPMRWLSAIFRQAQCASYFHEALSCGPSLSVRTDDCGTMGRMGYVDGGRCEIRTHEASETPSGFQDRCLRPLGQPSAVLQKKTGAKDA